MNNDKTKCEPCEQDFQDNLNRIIDEGRASKGADHDACEKELNAAFGSDGSSANQPTNLSAQANRNDHPLGDMPDTERQ